jgi:two-component system cell cycle response regulator DivK
MKKVLVIEDNGDNMRLIGYALRRSGYDVISAKNGEEGIALALGEKPFFILVDINLPGIDGIETTRRLRSSAIDGHIPIIAITSHAMLGDREKAVEAGCNAYFEKPINPLTIIEEIHRVLGLER